MSPPVALLPRHKAGIPTNPAHYRSCLHSHKKFNESEAEGCDERKSDRAQQGRTETSCHQFSEVGFHSHRGQGGRQKEGGKSNDRGFELNGDDHDAVEYGEQNEACYKPRQGGRLTYGSMLRWLRAGLPRRLETENYSHGRQEDDPGKFRNGAEFSGFVAVLESSSYDLSDFVHRCACPKAERMVIKIQNPGQKRIREHRK